MSDITQIDLYAFCMNVLIGGSMAIIKETALHESSFVIISKDEYDSMKATIDVLSDPELMNQLKRSTGDITKGNVKKWEIFKKEL